MKRLAIILCLLAFPASAQEYYRVVTSITGTDLGAGRNSTAYGSTSVAVTNTVGAGIDLIRVLCTTDCYIAIGITDTAGAIATAATGIFLEAKKPAIFRVSSSETIAVIQSASGGTLIFHELTR